jgi:ElaB/YqjD/DUF883 family membrane-anchored ribosome-binding protein
MNNLSPDEIATLLDRERSALEGSIEDLRDRLSLDALLDDVLVYAKANAAPYARALDGAVRANPVAAVMAGVGLAWLVLGRKSGQPPAAKPLAGSKFEALARWEDEGGPVAPLPEPDQAWVAETDRLRQLASAALDQIDAAARQGLRPAANLAQERARVLADLAQTTRSAMLQGLESLEHDAQDRIYAARQRAYAAQAAVTRRGANLLEQQPLVAGAIAMAIGAVVGSVLPRTAVEDRVLGQERDNLLAHARLALRQEREQAAQAAANP